MNEQIQPNHNPKQNPCHICGSQEFIWGRSVDSQFGWVYFRPDKGIQGDGERLSTRKCNQCKNVQFFADAE